MTVLPSDARQSPAGSPVPPWPFLRSFPSVTHPAHPAFLPSIGSSGRAFRSGPRTARVRTPSGRTGLPAAPGLRAGEPVARRPPAITETVPPRQKGTCPHTSFLYIHPLRLPTSGMPPLSLRRTASTPCAAGIKRPAPALLLHALLPVFGSCPFPVVPSAALFSPPRS